MIGKIFSLVLLGLAVVFGYLYYVQYWKWRNCFNELGRCFDDDAGVMHLQQSGAAWLLLAVLALGGGICNTWRLGRPKR